MDEFDLEIRTTADGSPTLFSQTHQATYHSMHGALQESLHVFIDAGLQHLAERRVGLPLSILEIGLGTGLNVWLTAMYAQQTGVTVRYQGIERFPIAMDVAAVLDYPKHYAPASANLFRAIHTAVWDVPVSILPGFELHKHHNDLMHADLHGPFDLIYFDAFGPETQPELWTEATLGHFCNTLASGGSLVTYCAKGEVRRTFQKLGLRVERLSGPPGKREMLRATRP